MENTSAHSANLSNELQPHLKFQFHHHCLRREGAFIKLTLRWFFFFLFFFYSYVHTMFGSFLPPSPHPLPYLPCPSLSPHHLLPGRNYFALISNFVEERV
jgi:hypothetical protein